MLAENCIVDPVSGDVMEPSSLTAGFESRRFPAILPLKSLAGIKGVPSTSAKVVANILVAPELDLLKGASAQDFVLAAANLPHGRAYLERQLLDHAAVGFLRSGDAVGFLNRRATLMSEAATAMVSKSD
jgi:hypothetical protein